MYCNFDFQLICCFPYFLVQGTGPYFQLNCCIHARTIDQVISSSFHTSSFHSGPLHNLLWFFIHKSTLGSINSQIKPLETLHNSQLSPPNYICMQLTPNCMESGLKSKNLISQNVILYLTVSNKNLDSKVLLCSRGSQINRYASKSIFIHKFKLFICLHIYVHPIVTLIEVWIDDPKLSSIIHITCLSMPPLVL